MSTPNFDTRYTTPGQVDAKIATQAVTDAGQYAQQPKIGKNSLTGWYHADGYSGVDSTGSTDSTAGLNAWLAAIPVGGRGYLAPGSYIVSGTLMQPANGVTISGVGSASKIIFRPTSSGTLWTISAALSMHWVDLQFAFSGVTGSTTAAILASSRLFALTANVFLCSWTRCTFQGNHTASGDAYGVSTGHTGISIGGNSGDNHFYDCNWQNLGTGIVTDSIQNGVNGGRFVTCYVGIYGTQNIDNDGYTNNGVSLSGYTVFTSPATTGLVKNNILIDGPAGQWWLTNVWMEGADTAIQVGNMTNNVGGPTQFGLLNSTISSNVTTLDLRNCRQPTLVNVQFGKPSAVTPTSLVIDSAGVAQGLAMNVIVAYAGDPALAGGTDYPNGFFPSGWTYQGRYNTKLAATIFGHSSYTSDADNAPVATWKSRITQTSNTLEFYDNGGNLRAFMTKDGKFSFGSGAANVSSFQSNGKLNMFPGGYSGPTPDAAGTYDSTISMTTRTSSSPGLIFTGFSGQTGDAMQVRASNTTTIMGGVNAGGTYYSNNSAGGTVLKDSAGHYWRVTISTSGTLTTTDIGTVAPTS